MQLVEPLRMPGPGLRPAPAVPEEAPGLLRVSSYNVMDGGQDRWLAQLDVLAAQDLDILGLQEAKHWDRDDRRRLFETAEALGMQAQLALSRSHGCHVAFLYRWPRVQCLGWRPDISDGKFHHTVARAKLKVDGVDLTALLGHLSPMCPCIRLSETGFLTEYGNELALLILDANSGGIGDPEPDDWDRVPAHLHSRHRIMLPDGTYGGCDRRAMDALLRAGFVDPPRQLGMTPPRTAGHWGRGSEPWDRRSDYVLLSRRLAPGLRSHYVLDTAETRKLGDHLPVIVSVDITARHPDPEDGAA
ncbi:endonuclease/exonuclease/phosphatase [Streptomyces sp. PTY087I2]|uniref:endonuclease/exonuclease/phosphatase n=1 Tax=Streptomyces sp. PTY087I2 TaxID=1819298 RepID=UPI0021003CB6|nr:endonuclease/exonuclease/phosphatase [Streptomyces sp. PTY087I2]